MTPCIRTTAARTLVATLALLPAVASAQQSGRSSRPNTLSTLGIHGFSVVLVVGSLTGTAPPGGTAATEGVPEAAKKALNDMKDFLPYKRYQLLDAAWMMCCASSRSGVSGRVSGPDGREYRYQVDPMTVSDTKLDMRFTIREMAEPRFVAGARGTATDTAKLEHSRQLYEAIKERDDAEVQVKAARQKVAVGLLPASELEGMMLRHNRAVERVSELQRLEDGVHGTSGTNIIDSTFSITPGETVVVGTSRLNGDRALIAILTAAAKPTAAK